MLYNKKKKNITKKKKTYVAVAVCTSCGAATMLPAAVVALMLCS